MRLAKATGRSAPEWIGRTADSVSPPHVRLRVFDRHKGTCHITGTKIQVGDKWDMEHVVRLEDGGENREANLAPALRVAHRKKTAEETKRGKASDRTRIKHIGAKDLQRSTFQSRDFPKSEKREPKQSLPPIALYHDTGGSL